MYAFVHIPKTAGSSVRHLLRCSFGTAHCDIKVPSNRRKQQAWIQAEDLDHARRIYPQLAGICGHRVVPFVDLGRPDLRYFTFLRDPDSRLLSHFLHFVADRDITPSAEQFRSWCEDPDNQNLQARWLCGRADANAAIEVLREQDLFVGLTARYGESVQQLALWLGTSRFRPTREHRNRRRRKVGRFMKESEMRALTRKANAEDHRLYQFVTGSLFPQQSKRLSERAHRIAFHPAKSEPWRAAMKRRLLYKTNLYLSQRFAQRSRVHTHPEAQEHVLVDGS